MQPQAGVRWEELLVPSPMRVVSSRQLPVPAIVSLHATTLVDHTLTHELWNTVGRQQKHPLHQHDH